MDRIEIVCIGTELLVGETLNTNLLYLGETLEEEGVEVYQETACHDIPEQMHRVLSRAMDENALVITVGGLGPTRDDRTRQVVAEMLDVPLRECAETAAHIAELYSRRGITGREDSIRAQSLAPSGAEILPNEWGTAPGIWCTRGSDGHAICLLPGPPREPRPLLKKHVLPRIRELVAPKVARRAVSIFGNPESEIERRVEAVTDPEAPIERAYCVRWGKCQVRLSAHPEHLAHIEEAVAAIRREFGRDAGDADAELVDDIVEILRLREALLGTAESCTGGFVAKLITDVPGVSDVFAGSVVTYSNEMKQQLLGVRKETLIAHGAVSAPVAREMVQGLLARHGLGAGISITGIAGPGGGTPDKPVGTVYIGTAVAEDVRVAHQQYKYDRATVRERTCLSALNQLRRHLLDIYGD